MEKQISKEVHPKLQVNVKNFSKFYKELNRLQAMAVDMVDGPILILAGPGTGKTQLLSVRAGSILMKRDVEPENILILTYTNAAAKAMKERLGKVVGAKGYDIEVGTFHSFANSIIQESEEAANYVGDKIEMDEIEHIRAIEYLLDNTKGLEEIRPFKAPYIYLKELLQKISDLKKDGITPDELDSYIKSNKNTGSLLDDKHLKRLKALEEVYRMYEELKKGSTPGVFDERGRYDFDDMILFATEVLKTEPALREEYKRRFRYIMVDEYQDTNGAQLELLFTLLDTSMAPDCGLKGAENPNLLCVGDDDQSIYRFQGASVANFKLLQKRFPEIKILSLKDNYRSTKELLDISKNVISLIPLDERMGDKVLVPVKDYQDKEIEFREFTTEAEEILYIIDRIKELKEKVENNTELSKEERAHPYNNIAILVRKRSNILKIIDAFLQAGIPYATDGKEDISGEKRVRQLLDVLELAYIGPNDPGACDLLLYKALSADYFQISHIDILRFISRAKNSNRLKKKSEDLLLLEEFLSRFLLEKKKDDVLFESDRELRSAARTIKNLLEDARAKPVHALLIDFIKNSHIFKYILNEYSDNKILRIRELRALSSFVNMVKSADMARPGIGLDDFMLDMKTRKNHNLSLQGSLVTMTQDGVRILTAHGSKGAEFQVVIIPFCLQNKNWPMRQIPEKILLPIDLFKTKEKVDEKKLLKNLFIQDETRLFYVAMTRAKSNLLFTASPTENSISSFYLNGLDIKKEPREYAEEEELLVKSIESTDSKDPFIGTEAVLKDMVNNMSLNPTRLNNYIICKRKFLYNDILRLPGPKKKSLVFGNCVHKALEEVYGRYQREEFFPAFNFFLEEFEKALKFQGVEKAMELDCLNKANGPEIRKWFLLASKSPTIPIGLEKKLIVTVGDNIIFTGKYDKIEWEDEERRTVRIIDYKTGKPDDHLKRLNAHDDLEDNECDGYLRQLVCYKLLFEKDKKESKGRRASHGVLVFVEPVSKDMIRLGYKKGEYVAKSIEILQDMVSDMERIIVDVWDKINRLQFEKLQSRDKDKCEKCEFDDICWR